MPGAGAAPTAGKSPDQDIDDRPNGDEVDIGGRPGGREIAVNLRSLQLRNHGRKLRALRKEDPKNRREHADFVDAPMRRELRPGLPGKIDGVDAVGEIKI